jgi:hypothetical protein
MEDLLVVTDGERLLKVNRGDAIRMELKLNVSQHKREWIHVGDALFNFGSNKKDASTVLEVTREQFLFLEEMYNMLDYYRDKPIR